MNLIRRAVSVKISRFVLLEMQQLCEQSPVGASSGLERKIRFYQLCNRVSEALSVNILWLCMTRKLPVLDTIVKENLLEIKR